MLNWTSLRDCKAYETTTKSRGERKPEYIQTVTYPVSAKSDIPLRCPGRRRTEVGPRDSGGRFERDGDDDSIIGRIVINRRVAAVAGSRIDEKGAVAIETSVRRCRDRGDDSENGEKLHGLRSLGVPVGVWALVRDLLIAWSGEITFFSSSPARSRI